MKYWKTISGVLNVGAFFFIQLQACASTVVSNDGSGGIGSIVGFLILALGVVNFMTRNSKKDGAKITIILSVITCLMAWGAGGVYGDLEIWGFWALIHGLVAIIGLV